LVPRTPAVSRRARGEVVPSLVDVLVETRAWRRLVGKTAPLGRPGCASRRRTWRSQPCASRLAPAVAALGVERHRYRLLILLPWRGCRYPAQGNSACSIPTSSPRAQSIASAARS